MHSSLRLKRPSEFIAHPAERFPAVGLWMSALVEGLGLEKLGVSRCFVLGSFLRAAITGEPFNDVDIVPGDHPSAEILAEHIGDRVELRHPIEGTTVRVEVDFHNTVPAEGGLDYADFTVCAVTYEYPANLVHVCPTFFEDIASRALRVRQVDNGLRILSRTYKYLRKGYTVDVRELSDILTGLIEEGERYIGDKRLMHKIESHDVLTTGGFSVQRDPI